MNLNGRPKRVVYEIPFDSERKAMSVIVRNSVDEIEMYTKGAPEVILAKCTRELRDGQLFELTPKRTQQIKVQSADMASRALRVLGLAYRENPELVDGQYQESQLVLAGIVGMIDPPR